MKIHLDFEVTKDEFDDLEESFDSVEFIVKETNEGFHFEEVTIDSDDLLTETFEDWIVNYLDAGFRLEKKYEKYIITQ